MLHRPDFQETLYEATKSRDRKRECFCPWMRSWKWILSTPTLDWSCEGLKSRQVAGGASLRGTIFHSGWKWRTLNNPVQLGSRDGAEPDIQVWLPCVGNKQQETADTIIIIERPGQTCLIPYCSCFQNDAVTQSKRHLGIFSPSPLQSSNPTRPDPEEQARQTTFNKIKTVRGGKHSLCDGSWHLCWHLSPCWIAQRYNVPSLKKTVPTSSSLSSRLACCIIPS